MRPAQVWTRRHGFTVLELLCVVAIIMILVSITVPAVMQAYQAAEYVRCRAEIQELERAVNAFKSRFGRYPPSRYIPNDPTTQATMRSLFPRADPTVFPRTAMEGQECLVFFLGGRQRTAAGVRTCQGFSPNPTNPMSALQSGEQPIGPFFQFQSDRLQPGPSGMFVYYDTYRLQPYAFFSSGGSYNMYNPDDCQSLGVKAFREAVTFVNPETFQVISAGRNGRFGRNGSWRRDNPGFDNPDYVDGGAGFDDIANFHPQRLGARAQ